MTHKRPHLFCFGLGYCAKAIGNELVKKGWLVSGSVRSVERKASMEQEGFQVCLFDPENNQVLSSEMFHDVTHILISVPPGQDGDLIVEYVGDMLRDNSKKLQWMGYFSTTGVYGDHQGGWVDEATAVNPAGTRGQRRVQAEQDWQGLAKEMGVALNIFRLPGIYGPGRNALENLRNGKARRIIKEGQLFSRIHLEDIVQVVLAAMNASQSGIFNVVDDEATPPQDVIVYAAELLGMSPPPAIDFENADLSPMAKSFYNENKRVKNDLMKEKLGIKLKYPDYRAGLNALLKTIP